VPLTFDDTVGGVSSTSYATLSAARDYYSVRPASEALGALADADLQALLMQATARLDQERWKGMPTTDTQRLQHPRKYLRDRNGVTISDSIIHKDVQYGMFELAAEYYRLSTAGTDPRVASALAAFKQVTVDVITVVPAEAQHAPVVDELPLPVVRHISHLLAVVPGGLNSVVDRA